MEDVEGIPWDSNPKDELRNKNLSNGVNMFMPFIGATYHFCNLQYRLPTSSPKYKVFMIHTKRCILEEGWGREPSTINNHLLEARRNVIKCKDIGNAPSYPPLGPHPVNGMLGMVLDVDMLMWSLDPGRLSTFAQFDTVRSS